MRRCPRAWCPDLHVHSMHPGVHVVQPRCPRRPCRPRPHHCACCTFSDMEHGAHGTHCRTVSMRTIVARCSRQDKSEKLRRQCPCREALALGVRVRPTELELELESFYSITTFIGDISPPPQIRQVAQLTEHYMQPASFKPHARGAHKQPLPETEL